MVAFPYHDAEGPIVGLLRLVRDGTEAGLLVQRLSQSRNEQRLAREQRAR
jgi:hypothetical protein